MKSWLQLIRPPNLVTVPGDPLAGFLLASISNIDNGVIDFVSVIPCLISALLLYMAGLMLNDCADTAEDSRLRPDRPIPSGKVSRKSVLVVSVIMLVAGVGIAGIAGLLPLAVAGCLAVLVVLYNFVVRRIPLLGIITMGLCRGCSVLLGAVVVGSLSLVAVAAALGVTLYIIAVSKVAIGEADGKVAKGARWFPAMVLLALFVIVHYSLGVIVPISIVLSLLAIVWAVLRAVALGVASTEPAISKEVGLLLRCQLLIQASFCSFAGSPGLIAAACLLLMWPIGTVMARKFYAS